MGGRLLGMPDYSIW